MNLGELLIEANQAYFSSFDEKKKQCNELKNTSKDDYGTLPRMVFKPKLKKYIDSFDGD